MNAHQGPDADVPEASPATSQIGRGIEKGTLLANTYVVERRLGSGGMAEVYLVRHRTHDTFHAVKVIHPSMESNTMALNLFNREAKILQGVIHDAIVRYQGSPLDAEDHVFLVMEYVQGISLSKRLKERPLTADEVICLHDRLCAGLAAVHRNGVVHRDLSPDNIILPAGRIDAAKIIDFGLSKSIDEDQLSILGDSFAGKYRFASPEQLGLYDGKVDCRADIYSLGLTLAAAARGAPFEMGKNLAEAIACRENVPDLATLPPQISALLRPMLEPDPAKRLGSIESTTLPLPRPSNIAPRFKLLLILVPLGLFAALGLSWVLNRPSILGHGPARQTPSDGPRHGQAPADPDGGPVSIAIPEDSPSDSRAAAHHGQGSMPPADVRGDAVTAIARITPAPDETSLTPPTAPPGAVPLIVTVNPGRFDMGSGKDTDRWHDESTHPVFVQRFGIAQHEVSISDFRRFVQATGYRTAAERADASAAGCFTFLDSPESENWGVFVNRNWRNPGFAQDDTHPVVCVNLEDARAYSDWLSAITGRRFRLPTEAEWEYSARAGSGTRYPWGDTMTQVSANCWDAICPPDRESVRDGYQYTAPRGRFTPNAWNLYDMAGNVSEWTCSPYSNGYDGSESGCAPQDGATVRVATRGGSWLDHPRRLRVAAREPLLPMDRKSTLGFRIAEDIDSPTGPHRSEPASGNGLAE